MERRYRKRKRKEEKQPWLILHSQEVTARVTAGQSHLFKINSALNHLRTDD